MCAKSIGGTYTYQTGLNRVLYQQLKPQSFIMTDSTFVCVLFGQVSSNKWWNVEEKGFASESIAQKYGLEMMSNVGVLGFAIFESNDYSWRPCFDSSLLPKEHSMGHNGSTGEFFVRYPEKIVLIEA